MPVNSPQEFIANGHAKVIHRVQRAGSIRPFTFGFGVDLATTTIADLQACALQCEQALLDNMVPTLSDQYTYVGTEVRGSFADGRHVVFEEGATVGGGDSDTITSNTAVLVEKRTSVAGRQNQGRMFIPGMVVESAVGSGGGIGATEYAGLQNAVTQWLDDIVAGALIINVVIFHSDYIRDPSVDKDDTGNAGYYMANPDVANPTTVTSFYVDPICATQRRRMR